MPYEDWVVSKFDMFPPSLLSLHADYLTQRARVTAVARQYQTLIEEVYPRGIPAAKMGTKPSSSATHASYCIWDHNTEHQAMDQSVHQ